MSNNLVDSSLAETTLLKDAIASRDVKLALTSDLVATKEVELDGLRTQLAKRDQNSALVQTLIDAADLEIKSLKAKMTIREEDIIAVKSQSNASLDEIKSLKQKLSTKENQVLQFENDLLALSKTADADMAELKDTQSELENASRDSAGLVESTRAENQKAVKALREEKEGLGERIDVLAGVVQKKDKELDAMTEKYEVGLEELKQVQSSMSKIASAAKEAEVARTKEVESLRAELDTKSTQLDQFAEQRPEDSTAFLDLQAAHAELQSQLNIAESTSQSINAEKVSLHSLLNSSTAAVAQHVTTIASLTSDCVTLEQELTAARSDLEVARVESQTEIDSMQRELSESKAVVSQAVSEKERIEGELSEMSDKVSAGEQELIAARSVFRFSFHSTLLMLPRHAGHSPRNRPPSSPVSNSARPPSIRKSLPSESRSRPLLLPSSLCKRSTMRLSSITPLLSPVSAPPTRSKSKTSLNRNEIRSLRPRRRRSLLFEMHTAWRWMRSLRHTRQRSRNPSNPSTISPLFSKKRTQHYSNPLISPPRLKLRS